MAGVYISWPFCAQKCTYCNFASGVMPRAVEEQYREALITEIAGHNWQWQPDTLYLGGGTPSNIEPEYLERLLAALPGRPWAEATLEAAPGSLTAEKVSGWVRAGINRVSLGVQSFVKQELARTGRRHDSIVVKQDVALLRTHGIRNINIDLIAGLPAQTEATWRESLEQTIALDAPHVSVYMLEVDEDSRLGSEILLGGKRYGAMDVPSEDATAAFYESAVEKLAAHGVARYEISNFARAGFESLHNRKYWKREPYAGFGADAHSFDGTLRLQNVESTAEYVERWKRGEPCVLETTTPDAQEEKFFVGLRLAEGVETSEQDWARFGAVFERFLNEGMLEREGQRLRLTGRGIMVSNEIFQEFLSG